MPDVMAALAEMVTLIPLAGVFTCLAIMGHDWLSKGGRR